MRMLWQEQEQPPWSLGWKPHTQDSAGSGRAAAAPTQPPSGHGPVLHPRLQTPSGQGGWLPAVAGPSTAPPPRAPPMHRPGQGAAAAGDLHPSESQFCDQPVLPSHLPRAPRTRPLLLTSCSPPLGRPGAPSSLFLSHQDEASCVTPSWIWGQPQGHGAPAA